MLRGISFLTMDKLKRYITFKCMYFLSAFELPRTQEIVVGGML